MVMEVQPTPGACPVCNDEHQASKEGRSGGTVLVMVKGHRGEWVLDSCLCEHHREAVERAMKVGVR